MGKLLRLRKEKRQRGQAMVEFALVLPLLLIVMFIVVDFGFGFSQWIVITNATREGARFGAVGPAPALVVDRTVATSNGRLAESEVTVEYVDVDGDGKIQRRDHVVVKATHNYKLLTPLGSLLKLAGLSPIPLSACSDMRVEQEVDGAIAGGSGC